MVLNYIWISFFIIAFIMALFKLLVNGDTEIFASIVTALFDISKTGFEIAIGLTGIMTLWLGVMNVGEKAGVVSFLSRIVGPFFTKLFPEIPKDHPAIGNILMNFSANMLGLDNAATPLGLKAMQSMQDLNPNKDTASNAQIMFLVLNTSGLTIIPISIMVYRTQLGAADPSDIFIPILIATFCSTLAGLLTIAVIQRINIFNKVLLLGIASVTGLIAFIIWYFSTLSQEQISLISKVSSNVIIFSIITAFIAGAVYKKINVYDVFIEGAKGGFETAVKIIPYLIAMLAGIAVFRASGAMDVLVEGITWVVRMCGLNTDFTPALPTGFMKPLSGSGSRGMMIDAMKAYGPDSFVGRLTCIIQGSADTTFYIVAVYFGSVGVKKTRYAVTGGLIADLVGLIAAIVVAYLFFH